MKQQVKFTICMLVCVLLLLTFDTPGCSASYLSTIALHRLSALYDGRSEHMLFVIILVISVVINLTLIIILTRRLIDLSKIKENLSRSSILHLELSTRLNQIKAHFIFNALMPLQNHIVKSNKIEALEYLSTFSQLIRSIINISRAKYISIDQEIIFLRAYLTVQQTEKSGKFDFEIVNEVSAFTCSKMIMPAILIQPIVENAINHGMTDMRDKKGVVKITFSQENIQTIKIAVFDNGKGFKRSKNLNNNNALDIVEERIELLNTDHKYKHINYNKLKDGFETAIYLNIKPS